MVKAALFEYVRIIPTVWNIGFGLKYQIDHIYHIYQILKAAAV